MAYFHTTVLDNQIKALPTVDTASGSVATFDTDLTENLVEVKCQIVAQQSGSGTPSPSNPLPITTYTEMNVSQSGGKNILPDLSTLPLSSMCQRSNVSYGDYGAVIDATGTYSRYGWVLKGLKIGYEYTLSFKAFTNSGYGRIYLNNEDTLGSNYGARNFDETETDYSITFTATTNVLLIFVYNTANTSSGRTTIKNIQLEFGSSATTFEPYNGTTANIPFGQNVANGVLDVTTGKLRVTHGYKKFSDITDWNSSTLSSGIMRGLITDTAVTSSAVPTMAICSNLQAKAWSPLQSTDIGYFAVSPSQYIVLPYGQSTTISDFLNDWGNFELCYPLATPQTIQLDSNTITALLNENNIWCDTGDTSVKYILSVGKAIS